MTAYFEKKRRIRMRVPDNVQSAILARMDEQAKAAQPGMERRRTRRQEYRPVDGLIVQIVHTDGVVVEHAVVARNVSREGIAFLHSSFLHSGIRCNLSVHTAQGEPRVLQGRVVRCRYVVSNLHEVAVEWDQPMDPKLLLSDRATKDSGLMPASKPPRLSGKILYIEDSPDDRELLKFLLGRLGVEIHTAGDGSEGLKLAAKTSFDLIITDYRLPGMTGSQVAESLRAAGYANPIITVTADENPDTSNEAISKGCSTVLVKPYMMQELIRIIVRYLRSGDAGGGSESSLSTRWSDVAMRPLILTFLARLEQKVADLQRLLVSKDDKAIDNLCRELGGSADGYGYPRISELAKELHRSVHRGVPVGSLRKQINELIEQCMAACVAGRRAKQTS